MPVSFQARGALAAGEIDGLAGTRGRPIGCTYPAIQHIVLLFNFLVAAANMLILLLHLRSLTSLPQPLPRHAYAARCHVRCRQRRVAAQGHTWGCRPGSLTMKVAGQQGGVGGWGDSVSLCDKELAQLSPLAATKPRQLPPSQEAPGCIISRHRQQHVAHAWATT